MIQKTEFVTHRLLEAVGTLAMGGSMLALTVALFPLMFGRVKAKWIAAALLVCLANFAGVHLASTTGLSDDAVIQTFPQTSVLDRGTAGMMILAAALYVAAGHLVLRRSPAVRTRSKDEGCGNAHDPVSVANRYAPEMLDDVRNAMADIERLRAIGSSPQDQQEADALTLATHQPARLMRRFHAAAGASASDAARSDLARKALKSLVEIGSASAKAADGIATRLGDRLDTEVRYVSMRMETGEL